MNDTVPTNENKRNATDERANTLRLEGVDQTFKAQLAEATASQKIQPAKTCFDFLTRICKFSGPFT